MPNYRNNSMPYGNHRQPQQPSPMPAPRQLDDMPLAMAYVPWQTWCNLYDTEKGFQNGTIFQDLNLPFYGKGGRQR